MTLSQKCQETENTTDTIRSISEYRNSKTIVACSWNNYFILLIYIYIYIYITYSDQIKKQIEVTRLYLTKLQF